MFFDNEIEWFRKKAVRRFHGPCGLEMLIYTEEQGRRQIFFEDVWANVPAGNGETEEDALRDWLRNAKRLHAEQAIRIAEIEKLLTPDAGPEKRKEEKR